MCHPGPNVHMGDKTVTSLGFVGHSVRWCPLAADTPRDSILLYRQLPSLSQCQTQKHQWNNFIYKREAKSRLIVSAVSTNIKSCRLTSQMARERHLFCCQSAAAWWHRVVSYLPRIMRTYKHLDSPHSSLAVSCHWYWISALSRLQSLRYRFSSY